ncbi:nitronate monooxygenase [Pollutimonas nitritireducens]|nr:nitronate monooxygenase [Pollutimonas nitritireducens]
MLGIEIPVFAFSHCRDVVVAASKAGGIGVFGAEMFTPEQFELELKWIEENIDGRPYGIDVIFPTTYQDMSAWKDASLEEVIPATHRDFVEDLLNKHSVAHLPEDEEEDMVRERLSRGRGTPVEAASMLEVAFKFAGVKLLVSAVGAPPREAVERAHRAGIKVGGMVGAVEHAQRQRDAGVDFVVAQGYEAGGHTGEIGTMVLTPSVVQAMGDFPVLAAGGIASGRQMAAAMAMGAQGVWCGSVWLPTVESDLLPEVKAKLLAAKSQDTLRTRAYTGKPARVLKSGWSDAWEAEGAPKPLMRPLQHLLSRPATKRIERARSKTLISTPVGQVVGQFRHELTVKQVYAEMISEFIDAVEGMTRLLES